ncbi:MAG TPA: type 1 glutamine amidotransferase domain-containing protein [Nocardioidaceae bacterium]|nr:type 1 glutamine amidotransferase domain-containing protein [Nocardioidaceae bacterium]
MARIAFLLDDNYEDSEFRVPYDRLREAGHDVAVLGLEKGKAVNGKKGDDRFIIESGPEAADPDAFDAVVVPGGYSPDKVRTQPELVALTRAAAEAGKPVAAICHAGWVLAEADIVRGRTVTSFHSIKTDLTNAGADWVDQEVVVDGPLITSRTPGDLDAFCDTILKQLG